MHFVQDLGKGILGKPDSIELWEEIIANIPDADLVYKGQNFLFPAIGHGTEVKVMAKRLGTLGWTKSQIIEHFYLCDKYSVFTNVAKAKGFKNVYTGSFIDWELDMKFDVVLGNPPYQHPVKPGIKIWADFLNTSINVTNKGGHICFVTPDLWVNTDTKLARQVREMVSDYGLAYLNMDTNKHFKIGESVCSYVLSNNSKHTKILNNNNETQMQYTGKVMRFTDNEKFVGNILDKVSMSSDERCVFRKSSGMNPTDSNANYVIDESDTHCTPVMHTASQWYYTSNQLKHYQGPKILVNFSGTYANDNKSILVEDRAVAGSNARQLDFPSISEANNAYTYMTSKLFVFFVNNSKSGGFNTPIKYLPLLDSTRSWTDAELYAHFNLTQEEIDYVESTVK